MKRLTFIGVVSMAVSLAGAPDASGQAASEPTPTDPVASTSATDEGYDDSQSPEGPQTPEEIEAERKAIWESPPMVSAREWLEDHMGRSAQITPSQASRYMKELERLTPTQMKLWLITFEEQQAERARSRETFEGARQMSVDNAMRANEAAQRAQENVQRTRNEAARMAQDSINSQQQTAQDRSRQLASDRDAAATAALQPSSFIWLNTLPWGPYAGYPIGGGAAIDPAAFQGVLGVTNREPRNTIAPGGRQPEPPPTR